MFQSQLPKQYWSYAIKHSVYLINRVPSSIIKKQTPYELLHKNTPDFSMIKVFGSLCFASTDGLRQKFDPRSKQGVFLGFQTGTKGYVILDFYTREIFVSRNVLFYESIFPFIKNDLVQINFQKDALPIIPTPTHLSNDNPSLSQPNSDYPLFHTNPTPHNTADPHLPAA